MDAEDGTRIVHEPDESRYYIYVANVRGGYAEYTLDDGVITFFHTVTNPALRRRGLAGRVVAKALDDARLAGLRVVPECWYVAQFIDRHPEYRALLQSSDSAAD